MAIKGNKVASVSALALLLALFVGNAIADETLPAASDTQVDAADVEFVTKVEKCLEQCPAQDDKCPIQCFMTTLDTIADKAILEKFLENKQLFQGLYCIIGCEASELCHDVNTLERAKQCFSACHKYCTQNIV